MVSSPAVYPRMRGEHLPDKTSIQHLPGLSPHARGTSVRTRSSLNRSRFIPACAGNIARKSRANARVPVYPRMRGEHIPFRARHPLEYGLSPHARGTYGEEVNEGSPTRFIPACAGNIITAGSIPIRPPVYPRMRGEH